MTTLTTGETLEEIQGMQLQKQLSAKDFELKYQKHKLHEKKHKVTEVTTLDFRDSESYGGRLEMGFAMLDNNCED